MAQQMPEDSNRVLRVTALVVGVLVIVSLAVGSIWLLSPSRQPRKSQRQIEPSEETTAQTPPSSAELSSPPSAEASGAVEPTETPGSVPSKNRRAEKVAFRLGSTLYIAAEDGADADSIVRAPAGPFALSPDGGTLAYVDSGSLTLANVSSGKTLRIGDADDDTSLSWSFDSTRLAYRRKARGDATDIWTVKADGTGAAKVASGEMARYAVRGDVLVTTDTQGKRPKVSLFVNNGSPRNMPITGGTPTAVAATASRVFVAYSDGQRGISVISMKFDGADRKQVSGSVPGDYPAVWGDLIPSPDGRYLAVQSLGDDGYARAYVVPAKGGSRTELSARRDILVRGWSADSRRVLAIEGNAFQGEPTELASVARDGTSLRDIVTGAQ